MLSTRTDQADGFIKQQYIAFRKSLTDCDLKNFNNLTNDGDRFMFVWNKQASSEFPFLGDDGKNLSFAMDFKDKGNKAFQTGSYNMAVYFYTKSLQHFPVETVNLKDTAITRANRSAALYHKNKFLEALKDIEAAILGGYPKDLLYKVKERKARCLLALKQHKTAVKAFQETLTALDDAKLKTENKQKLQRDVQIIISMMTKSTAKNEKMEIPKQEEELKFKRNSVYTAASDAVTIESDPAVGRYAVASRNIQIGEVILVEKPHCSLLLQEYADNNCFQCFRRVEAGEPCAGCSHVIFCSSKCQKAAMESHHKIECSILKTLWSSGLSVTSIMTLRIISQRSPQYFRSHNLTENDNSWEKGVYQSADYNTLYNLVRHESRRSAEDLLHRASIAVFLFRCLKTTKYFIGEEIEDWDRLIGGLLLRHLQILQFNAHEVSELKVQGGLASASTSLFIGGAVFPTLALFNHSCNPSITRYFDGTTVIARAIRNMKRGEQIAENYGPIFTQTEKKERLATLQKQYWFDCSCESCTADWPTMANMDITNLPFRCSRENCDNVVRVPITTTNCLFICSKCANTNNIIKGLKVLQDTETVYRLGMSYLEEGESEKALKKFVDLYKLMDEVLAPPFKDYHLCQQAIRTCFLNMGNRFQVQNNR